MLWRLTHLAPQGEAARRIRIRKRNRCPLPLTGSATAGRSGSAGVNVSVTHSVSVPRFRFPLTARSSSCQPIYLRCLRPPPVPRLYGARSGSESRRAVRRRRAREACRSFCGRAKPGIRCATWWRPKPTRAPGRRAASPCQPARRRPGAPIWYVGGIVQCGEKEGIRGIVGVPGRT
jgi:hypothetical protein